MGEAPAFTTTPAPSLPTGMDLSSRAASVLMAWGGMAAMRIGRAAVPPDLSVETSAGPIRTPRSEGLIGDASTRTSTSSGPGSGIGTSASESSSVPSARTSERNSNP